MKCSDVMTMNPTCALPGDTAQTVAQLMVSENVGPLPIVENDTSKKLVGIVTDRDLAVNVVAEGRDPKSVHAEDIMTRDLVTCYPGDDVRQALDAMAQHQVRRIPIVNGDGAIVGIIAQADVARRLHSEEQTATLVEEISEPTGQH